jgi:phage shock protein PspC (stress-responsive transcriptional regulator)
MKKVININFQGRVIPIEESAYEILQHYTDSLRKYFAKEDGRDEIINDIENRIAELFTEDLKKGSACITDQHVETVINSIGRPEDFDGEVAAEAGTKSGTAGSSSTSYTAQEEPRGSLYRNENDKVLGGVCSGLAYYLKIDPAIVRVLFALVTLGGFGSGIPLYIILWIVLPAKGMQANMRRRLYRNPESKVIGGVASGISAYFNIPVWVPRVIFALPLILGVFHSIFRNVWFFGNFDGFPDFIFGGFGGTLFLIYVILWMVIPEARTASEKLEMRGEKIDLESIKNSVQEELQGVKGRAEKFGSEFGEKAKAWGEEVGQWGKDVSNQSAKVYSSEIGPAARRAGNGFAHAIGVLFKAFFLFIAGIIVFAIFIAFTAVLFSGLGYGVYDLKNYVLEGFWQNFLAFNTIVLLFGIPIIAAVVWIIRRMTGARSNNSYLGWTFGSLWTIGLISAIFLGAIITRQFKRVESVQEEIQLTNPTNGKLGVNVMPADGRFYSMVWFDEDNEHEKFPKLSADEDSMLINTIRVKVERSDDSGYHAYLLKFARANTPTEAEANAEKISFPVTQKDSVLYLPEGFAITKQNKFRNQQVMVVIEVPVGKQIRIDNRTDNFDWFTVSARYRGRDRGLRVDWDEDWSRDYGYRTDVWYTMTATGLERTDKKSDDWNADENKDDNTDENNGNKDGYRYKKDKEIKIDTVDIKLKSKDTTVNIKLNTRLDSKVKKESDEEESPVRKKGAYVYHMISIFDLMRIGK